MMEDVQITGLYFTKNDPARRALLVNRKQSRRNNLLKYDKPVAVGYERKDMSIRFYHSIKRSSGYLNNNKLAAPSYCRSEETLAKARTADLMYKVLPAQEWIGDGLYWKQTISLKPGNRVDAVTLDLHLMERLSLKKANSLFLDAVRKKLHRQAFDEVIRQELLDNAARGTILVKCRDEICTVMKSSMGLWQSQMAYCMRKGILLEEQRVRLAIKRDARCAEYDNLIEERDMMMDKIEVYKEDLWKSRDFEYKKYLDTIAKLKTSNSLVKKQLAVMTDRGNVVLKNKSRHVVSVSEPSASSDHEIHPPKKATGKNLELHSDHEVHPPKKATDKNLELRSDHEVHPPENETSKNLELRSDHEVHPPENETAKNLELH